MANKKERERETRKVIDQLSGLSTSIMKCLELDFVLKERQMTIHLSLPLSWMLRGRLSRLVPGLQS